jgi:hypothetical protein
MHRELQPLLTPVNCYFFPEDVHVIKLKDLYKKNTVVIYREKDKSVVNFLLAGFEHIICSEREDFPQELLATALMVAKPRHFMNDPINFFFNDFNPNTGALRRTDNNLTIAIESTSQKDEAFGLLKQFWQGRSPMEALEDTCLQIADELFTNCFYNAPVVDNQRPFKEVARETHITLPKHLKPKLFTCFTKQKVYVGCEDPFGSIIREPIMYRLESLYTEAMTAPREHTGGSGLGFKFLIDNSANFYVFCDKGKRTLFVCGLVLKGLKANQSLTKNLHFVV